MKSWFLHICLFAGCVLSLPSCTHDEVMDTDSIETSVELTLSYASGEPISRDVASREDEDGLDYTTEAQCELAIDDIYILAFDQTNDKLLGLVEELEFVEDNTTNYYTKKIKGRMRPQQAETSVYFAVLTNLNQNSIQAANGNPAAYLKGQIGQTSSTIYQNLIYTSITGKWITNDVRIPMWGKTGITTLSDGSLINMGCNLYRAVAKVQIWMDGKQGIPGSNNNSTDDDFKITSIVVNNVNNQGYCASLKTPSNDIKVQYTEASVPSSVSKSTSITYVPLDGDVEYEIEGSTEKQKFNAAREAYSDFIYLPEHLNDGTDNDVTITINFTYNGESRTGTLYFKNYTTNETWDVIRNHSYVFNITGVNSAVDVESPLKYQVMNWWSEFENPTLNFGNGDGDVTNDDTASN